MLVALWIVGCGGPMEGEDWEYEDVAYETYAATTKVTSNLCGGCDLTKDSCVGRRDIYFAWHFSCQTGQDSECGPIQLRQCPTDCAKYQYCTENRKWSSCRAYIDYSDDPLPCHYVDLEDPEDDCNYPGLSRIKQEGSTVLTCTTSTVDDDPPEEDDKADLKPTITEVKTLRKTVTVEFKVCNLGDGKADLKTDIKLEFTDSRLETKTFTGLVDHLDARGGRDDCREYSKAVEADDNLKEGRYKVTVIADSSNDIKDEDDERNNEDEESYEVKSGSSSSSKGPLHLDSLKCESDKDGEEVECEVRVCINDEDKVKHPSDITVAVYYDERSEPGCNEEPSSKKGVDFTLDQMKGSGECRTKKLDWKVKDDDETSLKVWAVADVTCEFLKDGDSGRAESDTVKVNDAKKDDDDDDDDDDDRRNRVDSSSNCQLGGSPGVDLPVVLLLGLLALIRRRR
jgi:hypothetical protein